MHHHSGLNGVVGVCVLILVLGGGCTKKEIDADASGKSFTPGKSGSKDLPPKTGTPRGGTLAGSSETPDGRGGGGESGTNSTSSFPALGSADKGSRGGEIIVASAEPSGATPGQLEQMKQDQFVTTQANLNDVFFAFDSSNLTDEGKSALQHDAEWLRANPSRSITVEGHCDERGTVAYNLVLGERRAKAARRYLHELGIDANRMTTVSFGKERPFCMAHDEACYRENRRAHMIVRAP